jgi:hypothetical protein
VHDGTQRRLTVFASAPMISRVRIQHADEFREHPGRREGGSRSSERIYAALCYGLPVLDMCEALFGICSNPGDPERTDVLRKFYPQPQFLPSR